MAPTAGAGRPAALEDLRDIRVVHHGQSLTLGFEPGDDLCGVHARLDQFQCDLPTQRQRLLGQPPSDTRRTGGLTR